MISAKIQQKTFEIEQNNASQTLNGLDFNWDFLQIEEGRFHILYKNRSFNAQLVEVRSETKTFVLKINEHTYEIALKDRFDLLLEKMGMSQAASTKVNDLKAPMPGLIVDIKVAVGQEIQKGDTVLILEAMKMENVLKSPGSGKVKTIKVNPRESVEKNQVLIVFE
jgi:biotin carboxyl carrier protein